MRSETKDRSGIETVKRIVEISTLRSHACAHCSEGPFGLELGIRNGVNHYLEQHRYRLPHVGQRSDRSEGEWIQGTVAILGASNPPPLRKRPKGRLDRFLTKTPATDPRSAFR